MPIPCVPFGDFTRRGTNDRSVFFRHKCTLVRDGCVIKILFAYRISSTWASLINYTETGARHDTLLIGLCIAHVGGTAAVSGGKKGRVLSGIYENTYVCKYAR